MKYILCLLRWNQLDCLGSGFAPVSGLPLVEDYLYIYIYIYNILSSAPRMLVRRLMMVETNESRQINHSAISFFTDGGQAKASPKKYRILSTHKRDKRT